MQRRFDEILRRKVPFGEGPVTVLLALSGGVDSIVMADLFLGSALPVKCRAAHMNFSLRGAESDGDEAFVRDWCLERNLPLSVCRTDAARYASEKGVSIEMAARELRYEWFERERVATGCDFVAVAHNLNDNVETLFLNLLRGSGLKGLSGMAPLSGTILRPMLDFRRDEIEAYAAGRGLRFREDSSNADVRFSRNRIRHRILPEFDLINPSSLATITSSMGLVRQAREVLEDEAEALRNSLVTASGTCISIDYGPMLGMKHRAYWLFQILSPYGFNPSTVSDIDRSLGGEPGRRFYSGTHLLVKDRGVLKLYPLSDDAPNGGAPDGRGQNCEAPSGKVQGCAPRSGMAQNSAHPECGARENGQKWGLEGLCLKVELRDIDPSEFDPKGLPAGVLCADAALLNFPLRCRPWRYGDKIRPLGMKGMRLLSDLFTDAKLDVEQKRRQAVVVMDSEDGAEQIVCVAGMRIDDRFKVTPSTRQVALIYNVLVGEAGQDEAPSAAE